MHKNVITTFVFLMIVCSVSAVVLFPFNDDFEEDLGSYEWEYNGETFRISVDLNEKEKTYYDSMDVIRPPLGESADKGYNIIEFIITEDDSTNDWISSTYQISMELRKIYTESDQPQTEQAFANFVLVFIQMNFTYVHDIEQYRSLDYIAFPAQTIHRQSGDCEDLTVLYSSIMSILGYKTGVIVYKNHVISAIRLSSFEETADTEELFLCYQEVQHNNENYIVYGCETTPGPLQPLGYIDIKFENENGNIFMKDRTIF